jgi:hypothetical protein
LKPVRASLVLVWGLLLAALCGPILAKDQVQEIESSAVFSIQKARIYESISPQTPLEIDLPSLRIQPDRSFRKYRLVAQFSVQDVLAAKLWAAYFISLYDGGTISVNGIVVGRVETSNSESTVRHARPYLFSLPPNLLRNETVQKPVLASALIRFECFDSFFLAFAQFA